MTPLESLQQRVSIARLQAPAPDESQLKELILAAVRAADHGNLTPWRFIIIQDQGLVKLGELFAEVAKVRKPTLSPDEAQRFKSMPLRAPTIITVVAKTQPHPKVPVQEQLLSAGAAAQNLVNAAFMMGLGAVWRTGDMAYDPLIEKALDLAAGEQIIGFIYIGTPVSEAGKPPTRNPQDFLSYWQ